MVTPEGVARFRARRAAHRRKLAEKRYHMSFRRSTEIGLDRLEERMTVAEISDRGAEARADRLEAALAELRRQLAPVLTMADRLRAATPVELARLGDTIAVWTAYLGRPPPNVRRPGAPPPPPATEPETPTNVPTMG